MQDTNDIVPTGTTEAGQSGTQEPRRGIFLHMTVTILPAAAGNKVSAEAGSTDAPICKSRKCFASADAITAPVYHCTMFRTAEEYEAFCKPDGTPHTEIIEQTAETVNGVEVKIGTVRDDHEAGRILIVMHTPVYRVLALVRESHMQKDRADLLLVYAATQENEMVRAYYLAKPLTIPLSDDDPRVLTTVYDRNIGRFIFHVRQSRRQRDRRKLARNLRAKYEPVTPTEDGGYVVKGGTDHASN